MAVAVQPSPQPRHRDIYVSLTAEIVPQSTEALIAAMAKCAAQGVERVHIMMSTPGGSVMHGITLYNTLRSFPFELITHNVGNVNSIGNAIFLAGDRRYACPHSTFMFHGVGFDVTSPMRFEEKLLREHLDSVQSDNRRIAGIIEERSTLTSRQIKPLFLKAQTKDAEWAVKAGIVHEIRDVDVPEGNPVIPLVFQRQPGGQL